MITDRLNTFSQAQVITSTAVSENIYDNGNNGQITVHDPLFLVVAPNGLTGPAGATLEVQLEASETEDFAEPVVLVSTGPADIADLADNVPAGQTFAVGLPPYGMRRYLRARYVVTGGPLTAGTVFCGFALSVQAARPYPVSSLIAR